MRTVDMDYEVRRHSYVSLAHLASRAMKYREIVKYMKMVVDLNASVGSEIARALATNERALLEKGYKFSIAGLIPKRVKLILEIDNRKLVQVLTRRCNNDQDKINLAIIRKREIERELLEFCNEMLEMIDKHLLPSTNISLESLVYWKLKADISILRADVLQDESERQEAIVWALDAYWCVKEIAAAEFPGKHHARLAVVAHFVEFVGSAAVLEYPPPDDIIEIVTLRTMAEELIVDLQLSSLNLDETFNIETLTYMPKGITKYTLAQFVDSFMEWHDELEFSIPSDVSSSSDFDMIN